MKPLYSLPLILLLFFAINLDLKAANLKAPWVGADFKGNPCESQHEWYGPWDYTKPEHKLKIPIVEEHHFAPKVENLISGQTGTLSSDLHYVLSTIPNHHRALLSVIRYNYKLEKNLIGNNLHNKLSRPVECYLQRAINFSPRDITSVNLYAYFLKQIKHYQESKKMYEHALKISPNNIKTLYSYSLLLVELKQYNDALLYAKKTYALGPAPDKLKKILEKLGYWNSAPHNLSSKQTITPKNHAK